MGFEWVWDCFDAISITVQTKTLTRQNAQRKHLSISPFSFYVCVCIYIYIYIYICTHTRVCPVTLASTLSPVPGAAPRPRPFALCVRRRGINFLRRRGAVRRYSKLFTPAEYHFIYARARVCEMRGAASAAVILPFEPTGDRSYARSPFVPLVERRSRFTPVGQSHTTKLPAPAMTTAAAKVFLLFFFLGDFLFQRLDDIFQSRESSSLSVVISAIISSSPFDSKIVLFFFCHVSIIIIFLSFPLTTTDGNASSIASAISM